MTDEIDTSPKAVEIHWLTYEGDQTPFVFHADCAARVAELEAQVSEDDVLIAECESVIRRQEQRAATLEAKLETATEHAFKEGLRYSINVKISDEHDVQTAWDWSKLKQKTLAEIQTEIKEDGMTDKIDTSPEEAEGAAQFAESLYVEWQDGADLIRALSARVAELEERYLAVVGDKINLRGEVATLEAKLAKADAWQEAVFAAHPNIDLDIETKENDT